MKFYVEIYLDHNLGDDLFLDTLLQRYPEHDFYVGVPNHIKHLNIYFKKYSNLKIIKPISLINAFRLIRFDAHILIGGSVYMDLNKSFRKLWLSRLLKSFICTATGKPFFVIGANLGPFNTKVGKLMLWVHFNLIKHISVRDLHSYELLKKWKRFGTFSNWPDIVFSHEDGFVKRKRKNNTLGVSIINTKRHLEVQDIYIKKMCELIIQFLAKSPSNRAIIMGFDGGLENDGAVIEKILLDDKIRAHFECGIVEVINYTPAISMFDYLKKFNECSAVVCSRFHAMILAMKYEQNYFPICYSEKMENVLLDMESNVSGIKYEKISELNVNEVVDHLLDDNSDLFDRARIHTAKEHFNCIDKLISR
ncbi:polysaccharide pyruvyl transferase family protein [Aeromonas veronii]|uniref:polysaccharide pyruvyl transferase family protein n=1 Tax=Aeromonas veronii TaxID=654 RepID=UPI003D1F639D